MTDALRMLGGNSPTKFLRDYWQREPLLIKGALSKFQDLLTPQQLMALACREECRARLIMHSRGKWQLRHGPFRMAELRRLPRRGWALLVQDVNLVLQSAQDLLLKFRFISYARVDDLMISLAPDGSGVGPHFDSYDVFLLQGMGRRTWQLSRQKDLALIEEAPLRILKRFKKDREYVVESGDMLYLPPGVAHNGIAHDTCMTYSIGFRSPSFQELVSGFLSHLDENILLAGRYEDAGIRPTRNPGKLPLRIVDATVKKIAEMRWSRDSVVQFLGSYLTEPKPHVVFHAPRRPLSRSAFHRAAQVHGIRLDLRTQMLWSGTHLFVNGERVVMNNDASPILIELADCRQLASRAQLSTTALELLYAWYRAGYLLVRGNSTQCRQDHVRDTLRAPLRGPRGLRNRGR
jgi:50S ribosomal protein L16 3-hydroxylase